MRAWSPRRTIAAAILAVLLASCSPGPANDIRLFTPDGYQVSQTVHLRRDAQGLDGMLQILEDGRLTPGIRSGMWRSFNDPEVALANLGINASDPAYESFRRTPVRHAVVRLVSRTGEVLDSRRFEVPLAAIESATFTLTPRQTTFLVTADQSIGMGSYAGPVTRFATIAAQKLRWETIQDAPNGDAHELVVGSALKSAWRVSEQAPADPDILSVSCRPHVENPRWRETDEFLVVYRRTYFDGAKWRALERTEIGFWENEQDFPDLLKFPGR